MWLMLLDSRDMLVVRLTSWTDGIVEQGGLLGQLEAHHIAALPRKLPPTGKRRIDEPDRVTESDRRRREAESNGMPSDGWPEFCAHCLREAVRLSTLTHDDIRAAAKLASEVFANRAFDADGLFEAIENGPLGEHFSTGGIVVRGRGPIRRLPRQDVPAPLG